MSADGVQKPILIYDVRFPEQPPIYIRAQLYDYHFTTSQKKNETGAWWRRELIWNYMPPLHIVRQKGSLDN